VFSERENVNKEIWKTIKGYSDYRISNYGYVKSLKFSVPIILKGGGKPYLSVGLCKKGKVKTHRIHVLVATYFVKGKTIKSNQVNHKDGNKFNNCFVNLEWSTPKENSQHRTKILNKRNSILTCKQVISIRRQYPNKTYQMIADKYGISKSSVYRIVKRIYWKHL